MSKIFITGGFGYIGSVLAREALKRGHEVCIYDSLIYEQNIERMGKEIGDVKYIIGDTRNLELVKECIEEFKPDYVFHLAELSSVYAANHNPKHTEDINYYATTELLTLCNDLGIKTIYNSTSSVYGTQKDMKLCTESDALHEPTDYYVKYKLEVEKYIQENNFKNIIVLRPATIFGLSPRFRIELLPNHFTYMAVSRKNIPVSGLNAYRAAMDIDELIEGYFKILEKGKWDSIIYNIGHLNMNKKEFAEGIQKVLPDTKISFAPDIGDLRNLQIDCTKFNTEFNFEPTLTYEVSIAKIANWLQEHKEEIEASNFSEMLNMPLSNWKQICS